MFEPLGFIRAMSAHVSDVNRQVIGNGALDVDIPRDNIRLNEIGVNPLGCCTAAVLLLRPHCRLVRGTCCL